MTMYEVTDQDIARALDAGRLEKEAEFRARSVRYVPERDVVEMSPHRAPAS